MEQGENRITYADLQKRIDDLISVFGVSKTIDIADQLLGRSTLEKDEQQRTELLVTFIISESMRLFDCQDTANKKNSSGVYREARKAAYHLIKKYTDLSYYQMGKYFGQSKRAVIYNYKDCAQWLSFPKYYKNFNEIYSKLEGNLIQFMAKIN